MRVVHSFDAHFDAATHSSPSASAPLHIEEMGRPDSGEMSDGSTPRASAPARLSLTSSGAPQQSMALPGSAKPQPQRSRLAHQGSDAASKTERAEAGGDAAPSQQPPLPLQQLSQPTLATVNNSLYRNMAGCVELGSACGFWLLACCNVLQNPDAIHPLDLQGELASCRGGSASERSGACNARAAGVAMGARS